ncbi:alpha/beta hydrolase family protein [Brevundimonas sp. SL130]|uniref:alpha/beta hydrolase family protein n=1 Tax=Brevundimonas sp. SL130 TaxID=2995143 RepID=UPI00226CA533|nr:prolyl oligopeptidase family serine peptidase [Brevundimonas sp. SL130]WAC59452.1 prolyl oligopeptidase family serine peptidase [Brevundimonas sp. SL130]
MSLTAALNLALAALNLQAAPLPVAPPASPVVAAQTVDFARLEIADGAGPAIEAGVWTPPSKAGTRRPLIVISHGNGGDFRSHEATARALAQAGFTVAALTHTGDNWRDQSQATNVAQRPRQLHVLIDYLVKDWTGRDAIDPARVGAFGFSSGGFTVLTAAGGEPDLGRVLDHCRAHPEFYDCGLVSSHGAPPSVMDQTWGHDARIKSVVAAAPALGFTFTRQGLSGVTQPVQLWRAEGDHVLPSPFYAEPVRDALPRPPEYHSVPVADHFDFLPPCSSRLAALAPVICTPTPGFDRAAFQDQFNREVIGFFRRTL